MEDAERVVQGIHQELDMVAVKQLDDRRRQALKDAREHIEGLLASTDDRGHHKYAMNSEVRVIQELRVAAWLLDGQVP
jgi:hypothetical protein